MIAEMPVDTEAYNEFVGKRVRNEFYRIIGVIESFKTVETEYWRCREVVAILDTGEEMRVCQIDFIRDALEELK